MNWLSTQLKSPSTHNALASIAVATAVFAALGVKLPEAGETPAPKS